jgi:hypothetical protein
MRRSGWSTRCWRPQAMPSLPHLSLLPTRRRGRGSVYATLAAGELDAEELARGAGR